MALFTLYTNSNIVSQINTTNFNIMKKLLLFCSFAFALHTGVSAQVGTESDKVLVKTIDPGNAAVVEMAFKHESIVAEAWEKSEIRIELEIHANMPEAIIEQLIKAGRYTITTQTEGDVLKIMAANLDKAVTVKGIDLDETIKIHASTPSNFIRKGSQLMRDMEMIAALVQSTNGRMGKDQMAQLRKIGKQITVSYKIVSSTSAQQFEDMVKEKETMGLNPQKTNTGAPAAKKSSGATLKDMDVKRGDILIGGEPIDIE